jgi:hypothetical protein
MTTLMDRYRARREGARRSAVERALRATASRAVRAEFVDLANH